MTSIKIPAPDAAAVQVQNGLTHHNQGRLAEAEAAYRRALEADGDCAEAWHLLGVVALQVNRADVAVNLLAEAIKRNNANAAYFSNLGSALRRLGRLDEAIAAGRRAVQLNGDFPDALVNLSNGLMEKGANAEAAPLLRRVIKMRPRDVNVRLNLARALILSEQAAEAVALLEETLAFAPDTPAALINLGVALKKLGRTDRAIAAYRQALDKAPNDAGALNNLGTALQEEDRYDEALEQFEKALAARPGYADAHLNKSLVLRHLGRIEDSIEEARTAVRLKPDLAEAQTSLGFGLLMKGRLREGFAAYEWRSRMADFSSPKRHFQSPVWTGEDPAGKTILVHDEQGVGDAIQFARYAPMLKARGARVILECNTQLSRLFGRMRNIDQVVGRSPSPPPHDAHVSLLSLPHLLGTTLETVPDEIPYLSVDPNAVDDWRRRLGPRRHGRLRVGLVWAGNPEFREDRNRSPGLAAFLPLLGTPDVEFFALQKGPGRKDLPGLKDRLPSSFVDLGEEIKDFVDTAAIMMNLDLIISSCTAPPHLAGALARPVWVVLPAACDWRWLDQGATTPWYPGMRLFRQEKRGDWAPVIDRVAASLRQAAEQAG
jgi:tetratricopeptide (TPR) repeat protein